MLSLSTQNALGAAQFEGKQACLHAEAACGAVVQPWGGSGGPLWLGVLREGVLKTKKHRSALR